MGNEFPDFDKMTPEEAMAWLESLARRQGAKDEELITSADLDIPVPENPVIDEPGYVPFSMSDKPKEGHASRQESSMPPAQPAEPEVPQEEIALPELTELAAPAHSALPEEALEETVDPMQWLDSLTAHPGEELVEMGLLDEGGEETFSEAAFAEKGDTELEFDFDLDASVLELDLDLEQSLRAIEQIESEPAPTPAPPEEPTAVSEDDLLGGVDPMLWLESLAVRQGVSPDQLTTEANLEIEEVPPDAVVDEPGYVPFDITEGARAQTPTSPEPENEEETLKLEPFEPQLTFDAEAAVSPADIESLIGTDPMKFLESLARRQGAKPEELTTAADLEIPELPPDTVVDEPGYTEYSPFSSLMDEPSYPAGVARETPPPAPPELEPEPEAVEELTFDFETGDETLAWLTELAAEPETDISELLAVEEPAGREPEALRDPLAGMSDEDVAYAQARGELTPEQELAWLQRQAQKLAEVHDIEGEKPPAPPADEIPPAEPAELPDWLVQLRETATIEAVAPTEEKPESEPVDLTDWLLEPEAADRALEENLLAAQPADLPDWLVEAEPSAFPETILEPDTGNVADWLEESEREAGPAELSELRLDSEIESLWAETSDEKIIPSEEPIPESELTAFLQGEFTPEEPDPLAEALDNEFDRRLVGDESEPEWYTEAVARGTVEIPAMPSEETPVGEETLAEAMLIDMPDWLREIHEEPTAPAMPMPDWLAEQPETAPEPAPELEGMPDWLAKVSLEPEPNLDWLTGVAAAESPAQPEPEELPKPAPRSLEPAPVEIPMAGRSAPIPEGALFDQYRQRLEADPNDYASRLALARALRGQRNIPASLDHYEVLIEEMQLLQDVLTDLNGVVEEHPHDPRSRRLLGDIYMRQGKLQEALDAYRRALEQL